MEELNLWEEKVKTDNEYASSQVFPYKYDPTNETEAYLEDIKPHTR